MSDTSTLPPLSTPEQLQALLSGDPSAALDAASALVRGYCGWPISEQLGVVSTLDDSGDDHVWLPTLHLTDVKAMTMYGEDLDPPFDWTEKGWIDIHHWWRPHLSSRGWWPFPRNRAVIVTYDHGYNPVPADLQTVVTSLAGRISENPTGGVVRETLGSWSVQYRAGSSLGASGAPQPFDASELMVLDSYRIFNRP